jgi:hypothetical protein
MGDYRIQELAEKKDMSPDEFVGEMRKLDCSEPTALKTWRGEYENFDDFNNNDMYLSNLRKASFVWKVANGIHFFHSTPLAGILSGLFNHKGEI